MGMCQSTHCGSHSEYIRIPRIRRIATGDFGDSLESIPHSIWMNKQLPGTSLNRTSTVEICVQSVGENTSGGRQWRDQMVVQSGDRGVVPEQCALG